jgi:cobalt-zinc-cadmium resistance protein CzcA
MEEAVSGVKGELSVKIIGNDLKTLETKADEVVAAMQPIPGVADLGIFRVLGQPNLNLIVDRAKADRYGINVADVQDAVETAVGGKAVSSILIGEESYDLVVRYQAPYRTTVDDISNIRILSPSGDRVSLGQLCDVRIEDGASMIFREENSRYIAIKYSVRGRDLGSTVRDAISKVTHSVKLPTGYTLEWAGEYDSQQRANARLALIVPITVLLILLLLYTAFGSLNWSLLIMATLATAPIGGMLALVVTGTHFSVSSGIGMLALFGVSVQVGLIMIQYINQARINEPDIMKATLEGAVRSLRPTLMVMLVATLGLLPAALSHDIGSDSQRPFAIVIVGGLTTDLFLSVILLPTLYSLIARPGDKVSG